MDDITLIHGDCLEVLPTLAVNSVDAVVTDIPYNEANRQSHGLRNLDKGLADIATFDLSPFLSTIDQNCSGSIYIFCGFQQLSEIDSFFRNNGYSRRCLVWEKTNPSPMNGKVIWLSGVELCVYGKKPGATYTGFCRNTVLRFPCGRNKEHPTEKPVALITDLILTSTVPDDIVLDPCMGSGTTGVACVKTGRKFIGIEIDETYFKIAQERIAKAMIEVGKVDELPESLASSLKNSEALSLY